MGRADPQALTPDSVELKVMLRSGDGVVRTLAGAGRRPRLRHLYLLDTAEAALARAGVVLRVRRRSRGRDDVVVKARHPLTHHGAPRGYEGVPGVRVELDILPGSAIWAAELRDYVDRDDVDAALAGTAPLSVLFSAEQRELVSLLAAQTMSRPPGIDGLLVHGPLVVARTTVPRRRFPSSRAHLESCRYPDGTGLLEFSTRCDPDDAATVAAHARRYLRQHHAEATGVQQTKTARWVQLIERRSEEAPAVPER